MDARKVRGLLGSAGKALALLPECERALERLERVADAADFRRFLEDVDLGMAEPSRREFIRALGGREWRAYRGELLLSATQADADFRSPST